MPGGDRTGPTGAGPMTGRRAGYCAGYNMPGSRNMAMSMRGTGFGHRGGGHGWRNMFYATGMPGWQRYGFTPPTPQDDVEMMKAQASQLKDQLDAINKRIEELEQK